MDFPHCQAVRSEGLLMPSHDHDEGVSDSLTLSWNHTKPLWKLTWFFTGEMYKVNALFIVTKHLHTARKLLQFEVQQEN